MTDVGRAMTVVHLLAMTCAAGSAERDHIQPARALPISGDCLGPRWSPDGQWIALTGAKYRGIRVVSTQKNESRDITDEEGAGYGLAWSPDGRQIAFRSRPDESGSSVAAVKVANLHGGPIRVIARGPTLGTPAWIGQDSLAFADNGRISVFGIDGQSRERLGGTPASHLSWSADGRFCVGIANDQVFALAVAEGRRLPLDRPEDGRFCAALISPSGGRIVATGMDGTLTLFKVKDGAHWSLGKGSSPAWSPDGERIACEVSSDDGHRIKASDIFIINVADGSRTQLTFTSDRHEMQPAWSPDGRFLAYCDEKNGRPYVQEVPPPLQPASRPQTAMSRHGPPGGCGDMFLVGTRKRPSPISPILTSISVFRRTRP